MPTVSSGSDPQSKATQELLFCFNFFITSPACTPVEVALSHLLSPLHIFRVALRYSGLSPNPLFVLPSSSSLFRASFSQLPLVWLYPLSRDSVWSLKGLSVHRRVFAEADTHPIVSTGRTGSLTLLEKPPAWFSLETAELGAVTCA